MAKPIVRREARALVLLHLLILVAAAPATAQWAPRATPARAPAVEIAPYAGVLISDDLLRGPLGTAVGPAAAPVFGAQVSFPLAFGVSLIREQRLLERGPACERARRRRPELRREHHVAVRRRRRGRAAAPSMARPFVQVGAGGVHRKLNVQGVRTSADDFLFNVGAGIDLAFSRNAGLRLMARDYIGEFDFQEAAFLPIQRRADAQLRAERGAAAVVLTASSAGRATQEGRRAIPAALSSCCGGRRRAVSAARGGHWPRPHTGGAVPDLRCGHLPTSVRPRVDPAAPRSSL